MHARRNRLKSEKAEVIVTRPAEQTLPNHRHDSGRIGDWLQQRLDTIGAALELDPAEKHLARAGACARTDPVAGLRPCEYCACPCAGGPVIAIKRNVAARAI